MRFHEGDGHAYRTSLAFDGIIVIIAIVPIETVDLVRHPINDYDAGG